jgi:hypothetical protein
MKIINKMSNFFFYSELKVLSLLKKRIKNEGLKLLFPFIDTFYYNLRRKGFSFCKKAKNKKNIWGTTKNAVTVGIGI